MCIGIFSFRAFDRRLARLAAPISSGVRQGGGGGGRICPPAGRVSAEYPSGARVNPRPGGGLSHLRHGGGGQNDPPPPLTRKLGKLEGRAIRRSTALSEPVRSHFGHFFAQVNIEVSRGHQRSNFRKMMVLSGMPAIISGTIIATPNPKKTQDSS